LRDFDPGRKQVARRALGQFEGAIERAVSHPGKTFAREEHDGRVTDPSAMIVLVSHHSNRP
jgi:hypothetical protein